MENSMQTTLVENNNFKKVIKSLFDYLLELNYHSNSFSAYEWTFNCLDKYMAANNEKEYTPSIGKAFLDYERYFRNHTYKSMQRMKLSIRRLNEFIIGEEYKLHAMSPNRECPIQFSKIFSQYIDSLRMRGLQEKPTINNHRYLCLKALIQFDSSGIRKFSDIESCDIYRTFETIPSREFAIVIRSLLKYLFSEKITYNDLSLCVPSIKRKQIVPSVYTKDETEKILASFDRETPIGKRDYAIVLLALRLGIRSGDISNLKISDMNLQAKTITFIQQKTHVSQNLELLPEIEEAIKSYLFNGRQNSDIPNIFLTMNAPVRPLVNAIHYVTTKHLKKAGITIGERKHGSHSLRSTLASELVSEKVPYDVVRKILGHENPASTKHYVKFDIEALRSCAIEVPQISGKLEKFMMEWIVVI